RRVGDLPVRVVFVQAHPGRTGYNELAVRRRELPDHVGSLPIDGLEQPLHPASESWHLHHLLSSGVDDSVPRGRRTAPSGVLRIYAGARAGTARRRAVRRRSRTAGQSTKTTRTVAIQGQ